MNYKQLSIPLTGLILLLIALSAQAQQKERAFKLRPFNRLVLGSSFIITIKQGSPHAVVATGSQRDLGELEAVFKGTTLTVRYKDPAKMLKNHHVRLSVTTPTLQGLKLDGESRTTVEGFTDLATFDVAVSGASKAKLNFTTKTAKIAVADASEVTLVGRSTDLQGTVSGASHLKSFDFEIAKGQYVISGASQAQILVTKSLVAEASGGSQVRYRGAALVKASTSGGSTIQGQ